MRPPPKLETGPNAGIRAKLLDCFWLEPSIAGFPAFGPVSNLGGGRIYIVLQQIRKSAFFTHGFSLQYPRAGKFENLRFLLMVSFCRILEQENSKICVFCS